MIRFDHVSKSYKGTPRPALDDITTEVLRGEFVFVVGASGSGKSTFLRLVLREEKVTRGKLHVLGQDLGNISNRKVPYFRRNVGVVFQDFRLLTNKTVFDNVAFTLKVIGKSKGFIHEAVPDVLAMVGLDGKAQRFPHELSGGEQQRVAIARAVVNKPQILLADEPTGNLDPATSAGIMAVLERINAGGTTVLMATHEAGIVDQMQKRVIELVDGKLIRDERHGGYGVTAAVPIVGAADAARRAEPAHSSEPVARPAAPVERPQPLTRPQPAARPEPVAAPDEPIAAPAAPTPLPPVLPEEPAIEREPVAASVAREAVDGHFANPPTAPIRRPDSPGVAELTLAERLGLRAAGRPDHDEDSNQDVGPVS
ncbi:hypothetical protein GCM10027568_13100 [Humibacter soli]